MDVRKFMNKNYLTIMLLVFMIVKNPLGFIGVNIAYAKPQRIETNAVNEANIVENIYKSYDTPTLSVEEKAKIQLAAYRKALADQRAKTTPKITARTVRVVRQVPVNLAALYAAAEAKYGVPRQILAAVHMVESGQSLDTTRSSYAGAQGPMQFMPSTFRAYAQDGDGDGIKNIYDVHDAVYTAAKYLAANGAASGRVTAALYRYNHSTSYVYHVLSIARSYGYTG